MRAARVRPLTVKAVGDGTLQEPSDESLMARVAQRDEDAYRCIVDRYLTQIVAFAARTSLDRGEAEDVAQETFLRVWKHGPRWCQTDARFRTWLYTVAYNLCVDRLRRRREIPHNTVPDGADPNQDQFAVLHAKDTAKLVGAAIGKLPERQRAALALTYYQGLGNREAAEVMQISVEAIESLLSRARRSLRKSLQGHAGDIEP